MISSPIIKLIESIALKELKEKLEPQICTTQTGFITGLGTQVHILRLVGKMIDIQDDPYFKSGNWFAFFVDFKSAFDRVDHTLLFQKLLNTGISSRTVNILKLLYNSYHFSLPDDRPRRIKSGVTQGSLVSPLLYDWYVNDLVSNLTGQFGIEHTFAYADDIALLCLGYSEIRAAISKIETWSRDNGALINKKKCGILPIRKREMPLSRKELEGIPFVQTYKYLGVPLDSSLTLKYLEPYLQEKLKKFTLRIKLVLRSIVGTKTKLNLWQNYARCYFDYFSPTIALCGQTSKFASLFTKSLKKALDLPLHIPNDPLIKITGVPSLHQIAGYHLGNTTETIRVRFAQYPTSLNKTTTDLSRAAEEYRALKTAVSIKEVSHGSYTLDLLAEGHGYERDLLGLSTGVFLNLRCVHTLEGPIGSMRICPTCGVEATQRHFLNNCPINEEARNLFRQSISTAVKILAIENDDFTTFFTSIRNLLVGATNQEAAEEGLDSILKAAIKAAKMFVSKTLQACAVNPSTLQPAEQKERKKN